MSEREVNLKWEAIYKAKFRTLQGERGRIDNMSVYNGVCKIMREAELNALQTDFAQDGQAVDENFWRVVIGSLEGLIVDHNNCPLEVRNWFASQAIWA